MNIAYISFGANLANPKATLFDAVYQMGLQGIIVEKLSSLSQSAAWPEGSNAPDYINAALKIRTDLEPTDLMDVLLMIEEKLGRIRSFKNAPRIIDLDLIDYAGRICDNPHCILPHPRAVERDFVINPILEIEPEWNLPISPEAE